MKTRRQILTQCSYVGATEIMELYNVSRCRASRIVHKWLAENETEFTIYKTKMPLTETFKPFHTNFETLMKQIEREEKYEVKV